MDLKIYITEPDQIHPQAIELLKKNSIKVITYKKLSENQKKTINILFIRTYTIINKKFLNDFPKLKYILRAGVGLDNIDLKECQKREVKIINAPASNANAVAEFCCGLMIMFLRNINQQISLLRKNLWRNKIFIGEELKNKTIGLIGCGAIGKLIVKKLKNFEINSVLGFDPYLNEKTLAEFNIKKTNLNYLLKNSDIISLHLPLTAETKNLIGLKELNMMKKSGFLINTSRGDIVNETDLIYALKNKIIKGAALDVFENEPEIKKELLILDNLICTPHIAGYTKEADLQMSLSPVLQLLEMIKKSL